MSPELPIRVILDETALGAYGVNESVGELLSEIEDEDASVAVSPGSLALACAAEANLALLELLLQRDSCIQLTPMTDWASFGSFLRLVAQPGHDLHDAYLVMVAFAHKAYILTDDPGRYAAIHKSVRCIQLERPWP